MSWISNKPEPVTEKDILYLEAIKKNYEPERQREDFNCQIKMNSF